jgi:hypothetical protein
MNRAKAIMSRMDDLKSARDTFRQARQSATDAAGRQKARDAYQASRQKIMDQFKSITRPSYAAKPTGMKAGGKVKSASKRADGCAIRGKTRA